MRQTPLFTRHITSALKVINLKGVARAVEYVGHRAEHKAIREGVSICDASHLGEVEIEGSDALNFADHILTNDIAKLPVGKAAYTMMCRENGHIIDDLICYRVAEQRLLLVINVPMIREDLAWIHTHAAGRNVTVRNLSTDLAIIAVQGPLAMESMQRMSKADVYAIDYFGCVETEIATDDMVVPCLLTRTGYTGEIGYEIIVDRDLATRVWDALLIYGRPLGMIPHGVAARESTRTEAGYLLNGNDMDGKTYPEEAGVKWTVRMDKPFIGRDAIAAMNEKGYPRKLVGIAIDGSRTVRYGAPIFADGARVGTITSGPVGPALLGRPVSIGMGFVETIFAIPGSNADIEVEVNGQRLKARVVKMPFSNLNPRAPAKTKTLSPFDLLYTRDHLWLKEITPGNWMVGITDPGQREFGELIDLALPDVGVPIASGDGLLRLDAYRGAATLLSPVSGRIVARNEQALSDPFRVNQYPYIEGGLLTIESDGADPDLLTFADYRAEIRELWRYETWSQTKRTT